MTIPFLDDWQATAGDASPPASWARCEPALAGLNLHHMVASAAAAHPDQKRSDTVLAALLRVAVADNLARRVVLQALLPRLLHASRGLALAEPDEHLDDVIAEMASIAWELAASAAGRWPTHLAANVVHEARRRYLHSRRHQRREAPRAEVPMPAQRAVDDIALGGCDAARILRWAVSHGVISVAAERVLAHVAFGDYTDAEIAQRCGGTTAFTKKTRQRALHDLREHPGARALLTA